MQHNSGTKLGDNLKDVGGIYYFQRTSPTSLWSSTSLKFSFEPKVIFYSRVGALEAEKAHPYKISESDSSETVSNQVAASSMLIENLRADVKRLNTENKRLLGTVQNLQQWNFHLSHGHPVAGQPHANNTGQSGHSPQTANQKSPQKVLNTIFESDKR